MKSAIKLNYPFPKPYEQFNQKNYRARRKEAWRKLQLKHGINNRRGAINYVEKDADLAIKYITNDKKDDLENLLKNKRCENILNSTKLELRVNTARTKLDVRKARNVTAHINLLHLAVIERKDKCLGVMLKFLEKNNDLKAVLETITVFEDNYAIIQENHRYEVV